MTVGIDQARQENDISEVKYRRLVWGSEFAPNPFPGAGHHYAVAENDDGGVFDRWS
jgi:hypothetical protein